MSHATKDTRPRDPSGHVAIRPLLDPDRSCVWCAGSGITIVAVDRRVDGIVRRVHLIQVDVDCPMCEGTGRAGGSIEART